MAGTVYGKRSDAQRRLHERVTITSSDLREQLQELRQAAHRGADPDDVDAVKSALFAAHGF